MGWRRQPTSGEIITPAASDFTVDWTAPQQTIDGFGASDRRNGQAGITLTTGQVDLLFDPSAGIGLSLLRMSMEPTGAATSGYTLPAQAAARGARVWMAPWTPGAARKTNNDDANGGNLLSGKYSEWAGVLAGFQATLQSNASVPLYAVSCQNEPDFTASYDSCVYDSTMMVNFIKTLGPLLAGLSPRPKLIAPECSNWAALGGYLSAIQGDSTANGYTDIIATHDYGFSTSATTQTQPLWQTEVSDSNPADANDSSITFGLTVAGWIHRAFVTGGVTAWHYWRLAQLSSDNTNESLMFSDTGSLFKRGFVLGNWSRFVRPGWRMVSVSGSKAGILGVSAFKSADGSKIAVVIVNNSGGNVTLSVGLKAPLISSVAPWVTSGTSLGAIGTDGNLSNGLVSPSLATSLSLTSNRLSLTVPNGVTTLAN